MNLALHVQEVEPLALFGWKKSFITFWYNKDSSNRPWLPAFDFKIVIDQATHGLSRFELYTYFICHPSKIFFEKSLYFYCLAEKFSVGDFSIFQLEQGVGKIRLNLKLLDFSNYTLPFLITISVCRILTS